MKISQINDYNYQMYHARINHFFGSILPYIVANMTPLSTLINLASNFLKMLIDQNIRNFHRQVHLTKLGKKLSNVVDQSNFQRKCYLFSLSYNLLFHTDNRQLLRSCVQNIILLKSLGDSFKLMECFYSRSLNCMTNAT